MAGTQIWRDVEELPTTLSATLEAADGFADVAELLTSHTVSRIIVTGNGASYYVAQALWLAALAGRHHPVAVVAVPGGLVARQGFAWRDGDAMLAISSSGEFRDVIEAITDVRAPRPVALLTCTRRSTLAAASDVQAHVVVANQRAFTHTQAYCGAVLAALAIWARITKDDQLSDVLARVPQAVSAAISGARDWTWDIPDVPTAGVAFGTGPAWAAALEAALLIKELAQVPCEGLETREAATSAMTGLGPDHIALSLPLQSDPLLEEAEQVIASRGTRVVRAPTESAFDPRLAAITTFPAAVAFAVNLAVAAGRDPDNPAWRDSYYATARSGPAASADPS